MAADIYMVFEGTMTASETAIQTDSSPVDYTPTSGRMFVLKGACIHNNNSSSKYSYLRVGQTIISSKVIEPNQVLLEDFNMIVVPDEKIHIKGEVDNDLKYRLWGIEMDM